ncbi:MAG: NAD(P)/FAD-dependent oxidoreductase, partial [Candidatus Dormibacteraceae bacterium]
HWDELVGGSCGFHRTGLLNLVARHDQGRLRENVAALQEIGVETSLVGPGELCDLEPALHADQDELAAYEPRSGYADPAATTSSLAAAARSEGVGIEEGVTVTGLQVAGGRVGGVTTTSGDVAAPVVVLANGAWSVALAGMVGLEVPIQPVAIRLAVLARAGVLRPGPAGHPVLLDHASGAYARPDGDRGTLIGLSGLVHPIEGPEAYRLERDQEFERRARDQVAARLPCLAGAPIESWRAGPFDLTPDLCAIIDRVPDPDGLYLAVGMSGSGFKKAPAIGQCVAELIVEGSARTVDIAPFRLGRFASGRQIESRGYSVAPEYAALLGSHDYVH